MKRVVEWNPIAERLARIEPPVVREVIGDCLSGDVSPLVTLARLLLSTDRVEQIEETLDSMLDGRRPRAGSPLGELLRLLDENRLGCEDALAILHDHPDLERPAATAAKAIAENRRFFDRAVARNEVASVAAYALGDAALLESCTGELMELLERWGVLAPDRRVLEIGCGIGRVLAAIAPRVGEAHGTDISPKMIETAGRWCAGHPNVHLHLSSGRDLSPFPDDHFDVVLSVDSFPYIYGGGPELVLTHFQEAARVLRPGGSFVILNFSYRSDVDLDRRDVRWLADLVGYDVESPGERPFRLWDADAYHLRVPGTAQRT